MLASRFPAHEMDIRVRYAETDAMGCLHHARYAVYLEMGRTEALRASGIRYRELEARGIFYVVARLEVRFRAPARYDDVVRLRTETERFTRVRVDHRYVMTREGVILAEAGTTLACVGRDGRPMGLPEELWRLLAGCEDRPRGREAGDRGDEGTGAA